MRIVKKLQMILCEETIEVFDQLFVIAEEDVPAERKKLCGDFFYYILTDEMSFQDVAKLSMVAASLAYEEDAERRTGIVRELMRDYVNAEIEDILQRNQGEGNAEFEFLVEE